MNESNDYLIRAMAADEQIRAFALTSKTLTQYAKDIHHLEPLATLALGKLMNAGLLMGDMLKSKEDLLTIQIMGDGPLKHLLVTSDFNGHVKGYVSVPDARLDGEIDIRKGIGKGNLTVIRDYHLKEPYSSAIPLHTGDIASDLTYYFIQSEQTFSNVGLGVTLDKENNILTSGGYIVQLMPFTKEEVIQKLMDNLAHLPSVESLLAIDSRPEELLKRVLSGFDLQFTDKKDVSFYCGCENRKDHILSTIGKKELKSLIDEGKPIETTCAFCEKKYTFSVADMQKIYDSTDK